MSETTLMKKLSSTTTAATKTTSSTSVGVHKKLSSKAPSSLQNLDSYYQSLNAPSLSTSDAPASLQDSELVRVLKIKDPLTSRVICTLRNPKLQIAGYTNCIQLEKIIREKNITPDFGFDPSEPIVEKSQQNPWEYLRHIILPRDRQRNLWRCISGMNAIKRDYVSLLMAK